MLLAILGQSQAMDNHPLTLVNPRTNPGQVGSGQVGYGQVGSGQVSYRQLSSGQLG